MRDSLEDDREHPEAGETPRRRLSRLTKVLVGLLLVLPLLVGLGLSVVVFGYPVYIRQWAERVTSEVVLEPVREERCSDALLSLAQVLERVDPPPGLEGLSQKIVPFESDNRSLQDIEN